MKKLTFIFLSFLFVSSIKASPSEFLTPMVQQDENQYQEPELTNDNIMWAFFAEVPFFRRWALTELVANRCFRYLKWQNCQYLSRELIKTLDQDALWISENERNSTNWGKGFFSLVAFHQNLLSLLDDPRTVPFLLDLQGQIDKTMNGFNHEFSLWTLAKKHFGNSSLGALATLLQDTSAARLHLLYLDRQNLNAASLKAKKTLAETLNAITLMQQQMGKAFSEAFYPSRLGMNLNNNIYHFYVPGYLTLRMIGRKLDPTYARQLSFLLTISYEFLTTGSGPDKWKYLWNDPVNLKGMDWKIKDIYAGYAGTWWSIYGTHPPYNFAEAKILLEKNTAVGVNALLSGSHSGRLFPHE